MCIRDRLYIVIYCYILRAAAIRSIRYARCRSSHSIRSIRYSWYCTLSYRIIFIRYDRYDITTDTIDLRYSIGSGGLGDGHCGRLWARVASAGSGDPSRKCLRKQPGHKGVSVGYPYEDGLPDFYWT